MSAKQSDEQVFDLALVKRLLARPGWDADTGMLRAAIAEIERLRAELGACVEDLGSFTGDHESTWQEAMARIRSDEEEMFAEVKRLRAEIERAPSDRDRDALRSYYEDLVDENNRLRAELARAKEDCAAVVLETVTSRVRSVDLMMIAERVRTRSPTPNEETREPPREGVEE